MSMYSYLDNVNPEVLMFRDNGGAMVPGPSSNLIKTVVACEEFTAPTSCS